MKLISHSVKETLGIGKSLAGYLRKSDIIGLFGELGSGKTVFTKGIASGLGVRVNDVISPTFVLIRQHRGEFLPFYHFDLYRLKDPREMLELGYEEYLFGEGVSVIEWAERLRYLLPKEMLQVVLSVTGENKRSIEFKAGSRRYQTLIRELNENIRH